MRHTEHECVCVCVGEGAKERERICVCVCVRRSDGGKTLSQRKRRRNKSDEEGKTSFLSAPSALPWLEKIIFPFVRGLR